MASLDAAPGPVTHKFGGSSLGDARRIRLVADLLVTRDDARQIVVVSAMSGVTDALIGLADAAFHGRADRDEAWSALRERHLDAAGELLATRRDAVGAWLRGQFDDLRALLHALAMLGGPTEDGALFVQGLGEIFSARLLAEHLLERKEDAVFLDAREVLVVSPGELGVAVDWERSRHRFESWRREHAARRAIVTGFVARDANGRATTLGRNGSDHSAAIFAALSESREIHIWTDVDGVLSADPRLVPEATPVDRLSYSEACELAYFGAKVIHPQTMAPAIARGIPIRIRNTFKPDHPGTRISTDSTPEPPVKALTAIRGLAIVDVRGAGMIGVPGTAERVFGALHRAGISVVMISQGSSEHSICCVVEATKAHRAVAVLRDAFAGELERGQIQHVSCTVEVGVLAVVGDGMAGRPGIAARLFEALGRSGINVRAIAQGASERNISVAIDAEETARALRAVHAGFYLSPQTISLGVVGPGHVGAALLGQLAAAGERLLRASGLDLRLRAVAGSSRMVLDDRGLDPGSWRERLGAGDAADLERFADHVRAPYLPHALIVDCSASGAVAERYAAWLSAGIHVITPNKHAGSGPWPRFETIRDATAGGARFRYEATVGAGLPVITTLRDLIDTGDTIEAIEGVLSGTLAWLFHRFDGTTPFSTLVKEARDLGYTEPDPRDDLDGTDVARKLVILAREMGLRLSLEDVAVERLVPDALRDLSRTEFLLRVAELDPGMQERLGGARARGRVLRHVAHLDREGRARVGLVELPRDHPFARARRTDNVVQFTTGRYRENPLVVQGPGAGPDVTAAGVFADLLRVAASLGSRL